MVRRCVAFALALGFVSTAHADGDQLAGSYQAHSESGRCTLQLNAPSRPPEFSRVTPDRISGFVLAFPNCAHGLNSASLWQSDPEGKTLRLVNRSGQTVFTGEGAENGRSFVGQSSDGTEIEIRRD